MDIEQGAAGREVDAEDIPSLFLQLERIGAFTAPDVERLPRMEARGDVDKRSVGIARPYILGIAVALLHLRSSGTLWSVVVGAGRVRPR